MLQYSVRRTAAEGEAVRAMAVMNSACRTSPFSFGPCRVPGRSLDNSHFATIHPTLLIETHDHCQNSSRVANAVLPNGQCT